MLAVASKRVHKKPGRRYPAVTVDALVVQKGEVLLIDRKNPPKGWALPGGFVDYGESLESAVLRELSEETGLRGSIMSQLHTYSDPSRDSKGHSITTVFLVKPRAKQKLVAADDAKAAKYFSLKNLPRHIAFDHRKIVRDYLAGRI